MELRDVQRNYDGLAQHYDWMVNLFFHQLLGLYRWRRDLIEGLGDIQGATVLDVGCGTGNNLPLLMPRIGSTGQVLAIDYSEGMLAQARQRIEHAGWTNVVLIQDDATRLETIDNQVDAAVSAWCLGIVHDLPGTLHRLLQLTKSGGRIGILDFARAHPDRGLLKLLYPVYRRLLIATGIDAPEDVDDHRLQTRWQRGMEILRAALPDLVERRYLADTGILLHGTHP